MTNVHASSLFPFLHLAMDWNCLFYCCSVFQWSFFILFCVKYWNDITAARKINTAFLGAVIAFRISIFLRHTLIARNLDCYSIHLWNEYTKIEVPGDLETIYKLINN